MSKFKCPQGQYEYENPPIERPEGINEALMLQPNPAPEIEIDGFDWGCYFNDGFEHI